MELGVVCSECQTEFAGRGEFEAHVNGEHLDYFPFSCGHCSHYFTTEELAHFHAKRKKHLPMRIREHPNLAKEERLQGILERSLGPDAASRPAEPPQGDFEIDTTGEEDDATSGEPCDGDQAHEADGDGEAEAAEDDDDEEALPVAIGLGSELKAEVKQEPGLEPPAKAAVGKTRPFEKHEHCRICKTGIRESVDDHLAKHAKMFACRHCEYTGHSNMSVKVHITWKHKDLSAKTGVLELCSLTTDELSERCFGRRRFEEGGTPVPTAPHNVQQRPKNSKFIAEVDIQHYDANSDGGPPIGVVRTGTMPSGRVYRYMFCQECGIEVIDALASQHVFQTHIKRRDMVKCGYCEYSTTYPIAEVKRHCAAKHSEFPMKFFDHRQDPDVQELYLKIRARCFPSIQGSRAQSRFTATHPSASHPQPSVTVSSVPWTPEASAAASSGLSMVMAPGPNRSFADDQADQTDPDGPPSDDQDPEEEDSKPPEMAILEILKKAAGKEDGSAAGLDELLNEVVASGAAAAAGGGVGAAGAGSKAAGKYLTAAHIKNSQKDECRKCGESVTHLWESRHVWKHLEEEGKARYECAAANCSYKTYLLRNLDMHCNYHGQGLSSDKVGLRDLTVALTPDWMVGWRESFGDRTPPPPEGSTAARQRGKRRSPVTTPQPSGTSSPLISLGLDFSGSVGGEGDSDSSLTSPPPRKARRDLSAIVSEIAAIKRGRQLAEDVVCRLCYLAVTSGTEVDHVAENHMEGWEPGWSCSLCEFQAATQPDWSHHWTSEHLDQGVSERDALQSRPASQRHLQDLHDQCFGPKPQQSLCLA